MAIKNSRNKNTSRRCFLNNCVKLAAGTSLLAISGKSNANDNESESYEDFSYCVYRCPNPCSYNPSCNGCRNNDELTCTVRDCAIDKGFPTCAHCSELAHCTKDLYVNYPRQREVALRKQAQWGLPTGLDDSKFERMRFEVKPTVTQGNFMITNFHQTKVKYNLIDIGGKTIKQGSFNRKEISINIESLAKGVYILQLTHNKQLLYVNKIQKV